MKIKFLVIRFSSIGDIVLTSPVVRIIKNQIQNAEVHFVTKQKFACIVDSNPYIDKIHLFHHNLNELISELQNENFDYIIDLHQNYRSNRIKSRLKSTSFSFKKYNFQKFLLVNFKINYLPEKHIVDRYLDTLSVFDVKNDYKGLNYFISDKEEFKKDELPVTFQNGYIAFVIAGTYLTKKLPVNRAVEICNSIKFPVILLGGKSETEDGDEIISRTHGNVLNFAGKVTLSQSASLIKNSSIVLTNDTGLMHVAAAFRKKILSFWGNTTPDFGMYPYLPHEDSKILEVKNLKCRPCSKLGKHKCPKKHFKCMNEIDNEEVRMWINNQFIR
ncbi:MAG: glycosyltransferase family 9 protein [Draconibacterium sp.]|nr:glycosyltransferase family 9 protein [Draconibacterium sp.]